MKKRIILGSLLLSAGLVAGVTTPASAQWGESTATNCTSSTGCYVQDGKPVKTMVGPTLTGQERAWQTECNLRMAGTALAGAGGIMSANWLAVLGAGANGGAALVGPCKSLWNSTERYRS
ncbi:Secreted protein [Plantibacter sp. RU18]